MSRRVLILFLSWGAIIAALSFVDPALWRALSIGDSAALEKFKATDLHHVFRQIGNLIAWALLSIAIGFFHWKKSRLLSAESPSAPFSLRTPLLIFASPLLAGALAELLKALIGRERPGTADPTGAFTFKPFLHAFTDHSNLGMPSSHAAVAFGGAFMLLRLFPGAGWIALLWAIGCGITRLVLGAHYVSDVVAGAALGQLAALFLAPRVSRPSGPPAPHALV